VLLVALAIQVLRLGGGARELGLVNAAAGGTLVVFMLIAGVVVDRLPRRAVMIASDLARMAVLGYLAVASLGGSLRIGSLAAAAAVYGAAGEIWQLALLAILWGVGIEAFQVVWDTSLQELVRPEALGRVSSLDHIGSLALLPVSFAVVGAVADRTGAQPQFALAGLGAAALMCIGFLIPGVGDYRAPTATEPSGGPLPMLAADHEPTAR
jgi:MFS family permease